MLLRLVASGGSRFRFSVGTDAPDAPEWREVGDAADGGYLPPWDRGVRVALTMGGPAGSEGTFDWVRIESRLGRGP